MAGSAEWKACISKVAVVKLGDREAHTSLTVHNCGLPGVFTHCTHKSTAGKSHTVYWQQSLCSDKFNLFIYLLFAFQ